MWLEEKSSYREKQGRERKSVMKETASIFVGESTALKPSESQKKTLLTVARPCLARSKQF